MVARASVPAGQQLLALFMLWRRLQTKLSHYHPAQKASQAA